MRSEARTSRFDAGAVTPAMSLGVQDNTHGDCHTLSLAGELAHAVSRDALCWDYRGIVLREPFHLSYPYVFRWRGQWYMTPETLDAGCIRLYRARRFPADWEHVAELLPGAGADPSPFRWAGCWWAWPYPWPSR